MSTADPLATAREIGPEIRWLVMRPPNDVLVVPGTQGFGIVVDADSVPAARPPIAVGHLDGADVWAVDVEAHVPAPSGTEFVGSRELIGMLDPDRFALFARARMLVEWARTSRYCGACGTPTEPAVAEQAVTCPNCGLRAYPRISPVVIVRVTRGEEILLVRPVRAGRAMYTLIAGFVEAGESLEQAASREIAEEVGIIVGDLAYAGSQPWPFPAALMVGFTARYEAGQITRDPGEIVDAGWFRAGALPELPPPGSIARAMIDEFSDRHAG